MGLLKTTHTLHNLNHWCCHWSLWFKLCIVAIWGKFRWDPVWDHWLRTMSPQNEKEKRPLQTGSAFNTLSTGFTKRALIVYIKEPPKQQGTGKAAANSRRSHWPWLHFRGQAFPGGSQQAGFTENLGTNETYHLGEPTSPNWGRQTETDDLPSDLQRFPMWTHSWPAHLTHNETGRRPQPQNCLHICI